MPIIDAHVHLYPEETNRDPAGWARQHGEVHWALLCARVRKNGRPVQAFPTVDGLLQAMDAAGVQRCVLQGWYWEHHATCRLQNRFFAACLSAHPDRFSACAVFHPGAGAAEVRSELRWALEHGFCGVGELSPHSQLYSVDDPVWRGALDECAALGLPVMLHVTEPTGKGYPGRVLTPLDDFVRLAREHPRTIFVLAHWGARLPLDPHLGREAAALANLAYDTAASPLLYGPEVFRQMIEAVGAARVIFGSDFPLNLYPRDQADADMRRFLDSLRTGAFSDAEQEELLGGAARRVYGRGAPTA